VLVVAAMMKARDYDLNLLPFALFDEELRSWLVFGLIQFELAVGFWLLSGRFWPRQACLVAAALFAGFSVFALIAAAFRNTRCRDPRCVRDRRHGQDERLSLRRKLQGRDARGRGFQ
jgi:Methylamine utilisation protein MauE